MASADQTSRAGAWRLVATPPQPGAWNMACDEALGRLVVAGESAPVVRFFQWCPPAVSFGYSQYVSREVDVERLTCDGIDVVRRATGGRAVLHADELTYSIICREADPVAAGGITATYRRISAGLAAGLRELGVDAELTRSSEATMGSRPDQAAQPCFSSTSRAEVVVGGRKLIGSAQHRKRGLMVQHGSILLGPHHRRLVQYLRVGDDVREMFARGLEQSTTSLRELGWCDSECDGLVASLARGLAEELGVELEPAALSGAEQAATEKLAREKYGADWWNFRERQAKERTDGPVGERIVAQG